MGLLPIRDSRLSPEVLVRDDPHPVRIEESELLRTPGSPFPGLHRMTEGAPGFELPIERINNPDANPDLGSGGGFELLGIPGDGSPGRRSPARRSPVLLMGSCLQRVQPYRGAIRWLRSGLPGPG